jgi:hypothetical protein
MKVNVMVRNRFSIQTLLLVLVAGAGLSSGATIYGGLEDTPGSTGYEKNGDFNDLIFEITGDVSIVAPGGIYNDLTASVVNESGTIFWDNPSLDAPNSNVGYMLLGDPLLGDIQYLAMPNGGSVNSVTFDATGTVTVTLLGGIAWNADTLGWYDPADAGPNVVIHQLIGSPDTAGESFSFNLNGDFALYSQDGQGQVYSSISSDNVNESGLQQHFAFFTDPQGTVPEASTGALTAIGVGLLGLGALRRKKT